MRAPKSQRLNFGSESDRCLDQPSLEVGLDILLGQGSGYPKPQEESIFTKPVGMVRRPSDFVQLGSTSPV